MGKSITLRGIVVLLMLTVTGTISYPQCTWQTELSDGFEYSTVCPYLIPGTTIHNTPQSFAVHGGSLSLYLNFNNCVGGVGTCAGAKVFERGFTVCRNQPHRFSAWLTTSFSGLQCNVNIVIKDGNGTILNNQLQVLAPYSPAWIQYQSGVVTPLTDSLVFVMYTNVGGGNGNDLSMDDFLLEKCVGGGTSTTFQSVCDNASPVNLFGLLPGLNDTLGNWSGPSALNGGYLGGFAPGLNTPGTYIYQDFPFGNLPGCPLGYDSLIISLSPAPAVNLGPDTTLCIGQSMIISAGSNPGDTYLWSNGVTGPNVLVFTNSTINITNNYSVVVTSPLGCTGTDTLLVHFDVCSSLFDGADESNIEVYPNPTDGSIIISLSSATSDPADCRIVDTAGRLVSLVKSMYKNMVVDLSLLQSGFYYLHFYINGRFYKSEKLLILP